MRTTLRIIAPTLLPLLAWLTQGCALESPEEDYTQMSLEGLLVLHADGNLDINRTALEGALRSALQGESTPVLVRLEQELNPDRTHFDYAYSPFVTQVEADSLIVHGHIQDTELCRDDLIRSIVERRGRRPVRRDVTVTVVDHFPKEDALGTVTFTARMQPCPDGQESVFVLRQAGNALECSSPTQAFAVLDGLLLDHPGLRRVPIDLMWEAAETRHAVKSGGGSLTPEQSEMWIERLVGDDLVVSTIALMVLRDVEPSVVDASLAMDAVERHYALLRQQLVALEEQGESLQHHAAIEDFRTLAKAAIEVLMRSGSSEGIVRMYTLYLGDTRIRRTALLAPRHGFDRLMVPLVASEPGPKRFERLKRLFTVRSDARRRRLSRSPSDAIRTLQRVEGDDIDALLLDMCGHTEEYRIRKPFEFGAVWETLARRGTMAVRQILEEAVRGSDSSRASSARTALQELSEFMPEEEAFPLLMNAHRSGDEAAIHVLCGRAAPDSDVVRDFLLNLGVDAPIHYIQKFADPAFMPTVREFQRQQGPTSAVVKALGACGAKEEAIGLASKQLREDPDKAGVGSPPRNLALPNGYVEYLAETGDPAAVPALKRLARAGGTTKYDDIADRIPNASVRQRCKADIRRMRTTALLGLVRCGGEEAPPILEEAYESEDAMTRFVAAWGLCGQGEDLGHELIEAFTKRELDTQERFPALTLIRTEATDGALLARLTSGLDSSDSAYLKYQGYSGYEPTDFARDHERELLPILVEHLASGEPAARWPAMRALRALTGQEFGYDPEEGRSNRNAESVGKWRDYVEGYLGSANK